MKKLFLLLFTTIVLHAASIQWQPDYPTAEKMAQETGKKMFVFISTPDCTWCKKLKETTLSDPDIVARLEAEYVSLHVTRNHDTYPDELKAAVVPKCYFLTSQGSIIDYTRGYWSASDFNLILNDVNKRLKKMEKK